ncbi:MAG: 6-bladed beta-propeller [Gemmatimonadota bacterium]|nr:6-bladed beta-propeller [Gemmatimonadota bacterium]
MGETLHRVLTLVLSGMAGGLLSLSSPDPAQAQPARNPAPRLRLELVLPTDTDVFFGGVADADFLPDGSIVVLDPLNRTIYRFGANGSFLDSLGRSGRGPGELQQPVDLEVGPQGEIAVADGANGRLMVWGVDRKVATIPIRGWPAGMWWRRSGLFVKLAGVGPLYKRVFFHKVSASLDALGEPIATLTFDRDARTLLTRGLSCDLCPTAITPSGGLLLADPDPVAYKVVEADYTGKVTRIWERAGLPPVPFSELELSQIRENLRKVGQRFESEMFRYRPRLAALSMDVEGRLWVLRRTTDPEPIRLDVFDGDQMLLAEIPLPRGMRKFVVRGAQLLALGESPAGEPVVHVYRILQ